MHNEERSTVVARYWWQFTLREVFYFVALLSVYLAFVSYVGNYVAFGVGGLAFVALALVSQRSRLRRIQELYLLARCFLVGHFASVSLFWMIGQTRNAWGVNAPRFWTFLAAAVVAVYLIVSLVVASMRPLVEIRNDSGETLHQLSACLYLDDRLIAKYQWAKVRRNATRTIRPAILSGNLIIEYAGEVVRGRREIQLNLLRGEEFIVDRL